MTKEEEEVTMAAAEQEELREGLLPKEEKTNTRYGVAKNLAVAGAVMILLYLGGFLDLMRGHSTLLWQANVEEEAGRLEGVPPNKIRLPDEAQKSAEETRAEFKMWRERAANQEDPERIGRREEVKTFLIENNISTSDVLDQDDSPQALACEYLAWLDDWKMPFPQDKDGIYRVTTEYVLALLYFATGPWDLKLGFLSHTNPCYWYSVIQHEDMSQEFRGVACTEEGKGVALFLSNITMSGQLPSELGLLTSLVAMDLNFNALTGDIPESVAALPKLQNFFVGSNKLHNTGPVPTFGSSIRNINLSNNSFVGTLDHWKDANMRELQGLALDQNQLAGDLPALTAQEYPKLQQVYVSHNQFTGTLGEDTLAMENLTHVDISHNDMVGTIPSHLFGLPKLKVLLLNDNLQLQATQFSHQENNALEMLTLHNNYHEDQGLPSEIANLKALKHLDLSRTSLQGPIPSSLAEMTQLESLFLAENNFDKQDLEWLSKLTNLKEVSLKSIRATGPIPDVSALKNLNLLDLDDNQLTSSIPSSLGKLDKLRFLLLNRNQLTGEVPTSVLGLPKLDLFYFEKNAALQPTTCASPAMMIGDCSVCPCCSICCGQQQGGHDNFETCHSNALVANFDPVWQKSLRRQDYVFGPATFAV